MRREEKIRNTHFKPDDSILFLFAVDFGIIEIFLAIRVISILLTFKH